MISFFRNRFHKFCFRIYMIGKNHSKKLNNVNRIVGLSDISKTELLSLEENVSFGGNVMILGAGQIEIKKHTMIGASTIIHSSTHDYNLHPMNQKRIDSKVVIGKHVWIGTGVIINPGITIGDYSVIGSGSVVTKNIEAGKIAVGVPAKVIKERNLEKLNIK